MIHLLERARELDAQDKLAGYRDQFALPRGPDGAALVYLCGHSLGLAPRDARRLVNEEIDAWETRGVTGHHDGPRPWIGYAGLLKRQLALLAGAAEHEVVAMNSLTVNLHLLMASFYRPRGRRRCIVIEDGAFPSDRHAVLGQLRWHGIDPAQALLEVSPPAGHDLISLGQLDALLAERGDEVALVLWPGVQYRTGQGFDLARVASAARAVGAACGFDLAHAMGNLPLALHDSGADFAAWCSYKYLNSGPGALGGAFVHERHARADLPRLAGWWGHKEATRFRMEPGFTPGHGADGWQISNPPILSTAPLLASLAMFEAAGMEALRTKSLALGNFMLAALQTHFADAVEVVTPLAPTERGSQLSLRVRAGRERGLAAFEALGRAGIVADWREPDIIRVAPAALYNQFTDCARFLLALRPALA